MLKPFIFGLLLMPWATGARGQAVVDLDAYNRFLANHTQLEPSQLLALYPAGTLVDRVPTAFATVEYRDSIDAYYRLTDYEKELIRHHGFMVSQRLQPQSFGSAFLDIYHQDLPVYVSTDAILHALHKSYGAVLVDLERGFLRPQLLDALHQLHTGLPELAAQYRQEPRLEPMLRDLDVYLTVPLRLLGTGAMPVFNENLPDVDRLLAGISAQQAVAMPLFSKSPRAIDFSQFTPRGHYTNLEDLSQYFQAMIWFGRIELFLSSPGNPLEQLPLEDIQRQTAVSALLVELAVRTGAVTAIETIDAILRALAGEQDNLSLPHLRQLLEEAQIQSPAQLLDPVDLHRFQDRLTRSGLGGQAILSQLLAQDPAASGELLPPLAFLLFGQRFIVDSFITSKVVSVSEPFRGLPSTLDVLFALGNNTAGPLLQGELEQYEYAPKLAALRCLMDAYDPGFWQGTLYNGWLQAIRALNPPKERHSLPHFMRTAAWANKTLNTQLASWSQLRHDHLLYAKQSYTGGVVCEFPYSYIEPYPDFYRAVQTFASQSARTLAEVLPQDRQQMVLYFTGMAAIADTLALIAGKELSADALAPEEVHFLRGMISAESGGDCGPPRYDGWYPRLFFNPADMIQPDLVVADIHTQPTDEDGNHVGKVLHVGTGPVNLAVVVTPYAGRQVAFIGPVLSYYEHVSLNFKRLTDEEWTFGVYQRPPSARPAFVNLYLAGEHGQPLGETISLPTLVEPGLEGMSVPVPSALELAPNYPNPFNASTLLRFSIGPALAGQRVKLTIYNLQGQAVRHLLSQSLPAGSYTLRWDGVDDRDAPLASGIYTYRIEAGTLQIEDKMSLVR